MEGFRSIPLLVQAFVWYYVLPELSEPVKQWTVSTEPRYGAFTMAMLCLGTYSAARVAEQVRAGIEARSAGPTRAAQALGLSSWLSYRYVVLPVVYRIILPPLTSEAMSIVKNSSVAYSIGLAELFFQTLKMGESTFRYSDAFVLGVIGYTATAPGNRPGMARRSRCCSMAVRAAPAAARNWAACAASSTTCSAPLCKGLRPGSRN